MSKMANLIRCLAVFLAAVVSFVSTAEIGESTVSSSSSSCGVPVVEPVITSATKVRGGEEAKKGSWPWQVRVGARDAFGRGSLFCGGTILDKDHVLTAGHCFPPGGKPPTGQTYFVRVGDHNHQLTEPGQKDHLVKKVIIHESYNGHPYFGPQNDITILRLSTSITFSDTVSPACLPAKDSDVLAGRYCVVTGWGSTVNQSTGSFRQGLFKDAFLPVRAPQTIVKPSGVLKQAQQPILSRDSCQAVWNPLPIRDYMVCTYAAPDAWIDDVHGEPCQGDSGGPLACRVEGSSSTWNVEGIVSFGAGCGQRGPAVFTRVGSFVDWINQQLVVNTVNQTTTA